MLVSKNKKLSILLAIVATILVAFCCVIFPFVFHAESLKFVSAGIDIDKDVVKPGEIFNISTTVGTAAGENVEKSTLTIEIDNKDIELINFVDGKYSVTLPSGEVVTYTCEYTDNGVTITSSELDSGTTIQLKLDALFKKETSKKGETVKITLKDGDTELTSKTVTCDFDVNWVDEKTGPDKITVIEKDNFTMIGENTYTIKQIPPEETGIYDKDIKTIKMQDTISFPNGMFIKKDEDIVTALGLSSVVDKNLTYEVQTDTEGNITSVSFQWEENNDFSEKEYNFKLNNDSFSFSESFTGNNINNTLNTTLISKLDTEYHQEEKSVSTPTELVKKEDYVTDLKKSVVWSDTYNFGWDGSWGSATKNNILKYEISFKNNTDSTRDFTLKDTLPDSLEIMDESKFDEFPFWATDMNGNKIEGPSVCVDYPYTINGKEITWNIKDLAPGETAKVYVYCIVYTNEDGTITNIAEVEDKKVEHTLTQKKDNGTVSIEKTSSYTGTTENKEFEYIIKIHNNKKDSVSNRSIVDNLPEELELISVDVKYCSKNSNSGNIKTDKNNVNISDITVGPNEDIEYIVKVKIKEGKGGKAFTNTAYLYDGNKKEGESSFVNEDVEDISLTKETSKTTVYPGEEFEYIITISNSNNFDIDYKDDQLILKDKVPDSFFIEDAYYIINDKKMTDGLTVNENNVELVYKELLTKNTNIVIKILCKTLDIKEDTKTTINTAFVNQLRDEATVIIKNESSDLSVEKTAYHEDGSVATDVSNNEKVNFQIKITNNSNKLDVKRLYLQDYLTGIFEHVNSDIGKFDVKVVDISNVTGLEKDTILTRNGMWNKYLHDFNMLISNRDEDKDNYELLYYNPDFCIKPNGYIVLQYSFTTGQEFLKGSNKIVVNNVCKDEVFLESNKYPVIDIEKTAEQKNYSINELDDKEFYYSIKINNLSNGNELFQCFKVEDTLPDGLEFVPAWEGASFPSYKIYYKERNSYPFELWSFNKGEQAYVQTYGNKFVVEFGSVDDNGNSTLLDFKGGDYIEVKIKCRFSKTKIEELKAMSTDTSPIYVFENKAKVASQDKFKDIEGNIVTEKEDSETINIIPYTPHPGIEKKYTGAFSGTTHILKEDALPGDSLVWTINILNKSEDAACSDLNNFSVKDYIPEDYSYDNSYQNKMFIIDNNGKSKQIDYFEPNVSENEIQWNFDDISLKNNEILSIVFAIKNNGSNKYQTVNNIAQLITKDKINSSSISSGEQIDDNTLEDSASKDILINKTSSYKEVYFVTDSSLIDESEDNGAYSYRTAPFNYVQGIAGEKIYYKLYLKNESTNNLKNICFIDRMPFIGDTGIASGHERHSTFEVLYDDFVRANVIDNNGNIVEDISSKITLSFSNNRTDSLSEENVDDWHNKEGSFLWHDTCLDDDVNIRFTIQDYELSPLESIELIFTGYIPLTVPTGIENIAWNNFAYSYDSELSDVTMIAEPPKVGVFVEDQDHIGKITINKVLSSSDHTERTFYFALFLKQDNTYERCSQVQEITTNNDGSTTFKNIPDGTYYVFETDSNGIILDENSEYLIIGQGTEVIISKTKKDQIVNIENILSDKNATLVIEKYANEDKNKKLSGAVFELYNDTNNYTITTDKDGIGRLDNIPFGIYSLKEIKAPEGYQLTDEIFKIVLTPDNLNDDYEYFIGIDNLKLIYMPATGGNGYITHVSVGVIIIACCAIIFHINKKNIAKIN